MGCSSSKSKRLNQHCEILPKDLKFNFLNSHKPNGKTLKLLNIFNLEIKKDNPVENLQKIYNIIKDKGYNIKYANKQNREGEQYTIIINLVLDEENKDQFIIYSNFGKSSSPETLHGDLGKNFNVVAELIIKKYEQYQTTKIINDIAFNKIGDEKKKTDTLVLPHPDLRNDMVSLNKNNRY